MTETATVVGYTFHGANYCLPCTQLVMTQASLDLIHSDGVMIRPGTTFEQILDAIASDLGVDRSNESSFDSDEFPKTILADMAEDSQCGVCGRHLHADV